MTDHFTPVMRALVAAALLLASATLMLVAVNTARAHAHGALAIGACGAFGQAYDFQTADEARKNALANCSGQGCRVVPCEGRLRRSGGRFHQWLRLSRSWGKAAKLGSARNLALKACCRDGGRECVIRALVRRHRISASITR